MAKKKGKDLVETKGGIKLYTSGAQELKLQLEEEAEKFKVLEEYILNELEVGIDWGYIAKKDKMTGKIITDENGKPVLVGDKPSLFKSGAEKIATRTHTMVTYREDEEAKRMLGNSAGVVCYIGEVWGKDNVKLGEGRGCASLSEPTIRNNPNTCVKIAKKRTKVDSVIEVFGLSSKFTQDIEDMDLDIVDNKIQYGKKGTETTTESPTEKPTETPTPEKPKAKPTPEQNINKQMKDMMTPAEIAYAKNHKTKEETAVELQKRGRIYGVYAKGLTGGKRITPEVMHQIRAVEKRSDKHGDTKEFIYNWENFKTYILNNDNWRMNRNSQNKAEVIVNWMGDNILTKGGK